MRNWDEEEKKPFNGFAERDPKDHEHHFDPITHKCAMCLKTREELRKAWR